MYDDRTASAASSEISISVWMSTVLLQRTTSASQRDICFWCLQTCFQYHHIKHTLSLSWYSERRLLNNGGTPLCSACVISVSKRLRNSSPSHSNKSTAHKTIHYRHSLMASAISIPSKVCMLTDNKNTRTALQGGVHCFTWFTCSSLSCSNANTVRPWQHFSHPHCPNS